MRFHRSVSAAVFALCLLRGGANAQGQEKRPPLPDAAGREVTKRVCGTCHEIETVVASRRTKIGWERSVDDMISRGAEGSDEDMAAVVEYLAANFGKVNVNTARPAELEKSLGLTASEAQAIVAYRERNSKIKDFEELKKVPGVSAEKLQAKRGLIAFSL